MKKTELRSFVENLKPRKGWDNIPFRFKKGDGYLGLSNKKICMEHCFACGVENWAMSVASGSCAFCGYNPNNDLV